MTRVLLAGAVLLSACATTTPAESRRAFIHQSISDHVFERSASDVLAEARNLLDEEGYFVRGSHEVKSLTTEWKEVMATSNVVGSYSRYLVEVFPVGEGRSKVRIHRNTAVTAEGKAIDGWTSRIDRSAGPGAPGVGAVGPNGSLPGYGSTAQVQRTEVSAVEYAENAHGTEVQHGTLSRDLQMEWLLLQRLQPEDAKELQTVAEQKFQ